MKKLSLRTLWTTLFALLLVTALMGFAGCSKDDDDEEETTPTNSGTSDTIPGWELVINDPLTSGSSALAIMEGGYYIQGEGYHLPNQTGSIGYITNITKNIRLEFDAKGYHAGENDPYQGKMVIFQMYDSPFGSSWSGADSNSWNNHSILRLLKRGNYASVMDALQLKFGSRGDFPEPSNTDPRPFVVSCNWDTTVKYHWVIIVEGDETVITRNGTTYYDMDTEEFDPEYPLNLQIGGAATGSGYYSPSDVTYSNIKVYRKL